MAIETDGATELRAGERHEFETHAWSDSIRRFADIAACRKALNSAVKRQLDLLGALLLAIVFSPLMPLILVMMHGAGGPVSYKHRRVGRDGRMFECLKFRTMVPNADQMLRDLLERDAELMAEWVRGHKLR